MYDLDDEEEPVYVDPIFQRDPGDETDEEEGGVRIPRRPSKPSGSSGAYAERPVTSPELELVGASL